MFIPIIIGFVGLMVGGRSKPLGKHKKLVMLGPTSGEHYNTEDMPESAIVVVHAKDGTSVTFDRDIETGRLKFKCARGNKGTVSIVREDFEKPVVLSARDNVVDGNFPKASA